MSKTIPAVDGYIRKNKAWDEPLQALRRIILDCDLTEEVKWRVPCYTSGGRNVVFVNAFKESCAINFVNGALLEDTGGLLEKIGENTQAGRRIRFTRLQEILDVEPTLKAFIRSAVAAEKAGLKVELKKTSDHPVPEELRSKLDEMPELKAAFDALTPGRQRGYLLYFSSAKQASTRASRVDKCVPRILDGKGLDD